MDLLAAYDEDDSGSSGDEAAASSEAAEINPFSHVGHSDSDEEGEKVCLQKCMRGLSGMRVPRSSSSLLHGRHRRRERSSTLSPLPSTLPSAPMCTYRRPPPHPVLEFCPQQAICSGTASPAHFVRTWHAFTHARERPARHIRPAPRAAPTPARFPWPGTRPSGRAGSTCTLTRRRRWSTTTRTSIPTVA